MVRVLALPTLELVRRSPSKHLPPALRSVRTTLLVRSIAVAHMQNVLPKHGRNLTVEWTFLKKTLIFVPPRRSKRVTAARTRHSVLSRS